MTRKIRRLQELSLVDAKLTLNLPRIQLLYWLQALPSLKKLSYSLEAQSYQKAWIKLQCQRIVRYLKMQNRLESLSFNLSGISEFFFVNLMRFPQYPRSLCHLSVKGYCGHFWNDKTNSEDLQLSLSKMTKLEYLEFHMGSELVHSGTLLDFITSAPQIRFLDISIPFSLDNSVINPERMKGLEGVRLVFKGTAFEQALNLFRIPSLSYVSLALSLSDPSQLSGLVTYVSQFKNLASLKIKAKCISTTIFLQENLFRDLFRQIGKIQTLKILSLSFKFTGGNAARSQRKPVNILSGIDEIFLYGIKLEKLSLIFDEAGDEKTVPKLVEILDGVKEGLVKLKIDIGRGEMKIREAEKFIRFIKEMKLLKVLKINCLNLEGRTSLKGFVEAIKGMENLKKLRFGKIDEGIENKKVIESVERMLGKKGLREFGCEIAKKWMMKEEYSVSCWKILKKNPDLELVDKRLQIFRGNWVKKFVFCRQKYYWF